MGLKTREPVLVLIFSLITCSIYYWYYVYSVTNEVELSLREKDGTCSSGGLAVLFSLITCNIYGIYWWYKMGQKAARLGQENNVPVADNGVIYVVLAVLNGIGILVNPFLLQNELNKVTAVANR